MGKKKSPNVTDVYNRSVTSYNQSQSPSQLETEMAPISQNFMNNYNTAVNRNTEDYGNVMSGYQGFMKNFKPSFERVAATRPDELNEGYGYLREAMPGYRNFAETGGYSPQDVQELRARGIAPIRSAYGNTMMQLDRQRALGGSGGSANYIAARSKAQRELPGQMADAMTNVNAGLAESIREGKKFGLQGISGTGQTMGGLASDEAGRQLQAGIANQRAGLEAQQMNMQGQLGALGGMTSLYGTTPGLSSMFGNQALNAYNLRGDLESGRLNRGLNAIDQQLRATQLQQQQKPWWQTALGIAGTVAPYAAMAFGGPLAAAGTKGLYSGISKVAGGEYA